MTRNQAPRPQVPMRQVRLPIRETKRVLSESGAGYDVGAGRHGDIMSMSFFRGF